MMLLFQPATLTAW